MKIGNLKKLVAGLMVTVLVVSTQPLDVAAGTITNTDIQLLENEVVEEVSTNEVNQDEKQIEISQNEISNNVIIDDTENAEEKNSISLDVLQKNEVSDNSLNEVELGSEIIKEKQELSETLIDLEDAVAGVDYAEHEAIFMSDKIDEAQKIAKEYDAQIVYANEGVYTIKFDEEVKEIIELASDTENSYTPVYPNYIYSVIPVKGVNTKNIDEISGNHTGEIFFEEEKTLSKKLNLSIEETNKLLQTTNDPLLSDQWYHKIINSQFAWEKTSGSSDVTVAVIDTGIAANHSDLKASIKSTVDMTNSKYGVEDQDGHGSNVAGIIASVANNEVGGVGIANSVKLHAVKVEDDNGLIYDSYIIAGIRNSISNGAKVINMSLGGSYKNILEERAIRDAVEAGVVVVSAAGNENTNQKSYPASYADSMCVAAVGSNGEKASFSNYGNQVDIAAPGGNVVYQQDAAGYIYYNKYYINSTYKGEGYVGMAGTSQASPMVAAGAALVYSVNSDLFNNSTRESSEAVRKILKNTATKAGNSQYYGSGILNVAAAVGAPYTVDVPTVIVKNENGEIVEGNTIPEKSTITIENKLKDAITFYAIGGGNTYSSYSKPFELKGTGKKELLLFSYAYGKYSKDIKKTYTITPAKKSVTTAVSLNIAPITKMFYGDELQLTPTAVSNETMTNFLYTSSNSKIVRVLEDGKIQARMKGTAKVTVMADDGSKKKTVCTITVKTPVRSLDITSSTGVSRIAVGKKLKLIPIFNEGKKAETPDDKTVTWSIKSGTEYASINNKGELSAIKEGTVSVELKSKATRTGEEKSDTYSVTVYPITQEVTIRGFLNSIYKNSSSETISIYEGGDRNYTDIEPLIMSNPSNTARVYSYSSSNKKVALISNEGFIVPLAVGTTKITVKSLDGSNKKATLTLKVIQPAQSIAVTSNTGIEAVGSGGNISLTASVLPAEASKKVQWCFVDANGLMQTKLGGNVISAKGVLTAEKGVNTKKVVTVTALVNPVKTYNFLENRIDVSCDVSTKCTITIYPATTSINLSDKIINLNVGGSKKLSVTTNPITALGEYRYLTSNSRIASVDSDGNICAKSKGNATITVKALDGSGKNVKCNVTVK
ncbi:MAG: S8 family serine peptidase [Lachnospiraceae bacterium]|nr:S8 family serine peptidase [Lachnospiraceae bacterium]